MFDYHVHTSFSADSQEPVESYLNELQARGITEFCVTEHMAVNFHRGNWMVDLDAYVPKIRALQAAGYPVKLGIEADVNCAACDVEELVTQLSRYPLDFVLVSSHCFMGSDPYQEDMFQNRDAIEVCRSYLQDLYTCLQRIDPALFSALAHLDYLAKGFGATYLPGGLFRYEYAPDELDAVMRYRARPLHRDQHLLPAVAPRRQRAGARLAAALSRARRRVRHPGFRRTPGLPLR